MITNPVAPPNNGYIGGGYNYPRTNKTITTTRITTTREYDTKGNLVKETIVETVYDGGYYEPYWGTPLRGTGAIQKDYTVTYNNGTDIL